MRITDLILAFVLGLALQYPNGAVAQDSRYRLPANTKLPTSPAAGYRLLNMRFNVPTCMQLAEEAVKQTRVDNMEFSGIRKGKFYVGGNILYTRGDIICVQLPKAGACYGDGATAVIVVAGPKSKQTTVTQMTENMTTQMNALIKNYTLIDCN